MMRFLRHFCLFLMLATLAAAQTAVVTRNVNLRPDPSKDNDPLMTLEPGTQLQLLAPDATDGFYNAKTADGSEGWVWGRNIKIQAGDQTPGVAEHVGPARLYPNTAKTPGQADTLNLEDLTRRYTEGCPGKKPSCTYSQSHRDVNKKVHTQVYDEYKVPQAKRNIKTGEVDHFYPLCAGGSNDIKNLWFQPAVNDWNGQDFGFHAKDKLEAYICIQIKAGKLDPKEAFDRMTKDWVKFYLDEGLDSSD